MIEYIDRLSGRLNVEQVYGQKAIEFVYGDSWFSCLVGKPSLHLFLKYPFFAWAYGFWQRRALSKRKVLPFIRRFGVDPSEFADSVESYASFDAFFTRRLKASTRPIAAGRQEAVMPADGRYLFYPNIAAADGFFIKGQKFDLATFLGDANLAKNYAEGTMVIARLCPTDYHRFHFPVDCIPSKAQLINGWLYSVNPMALKKCVRLVTQNRRMVTLLDSQCFGRVLSVEVGATCVGSIHQTYTPGKFYAKGAEKGYFSFGASMMVLLFEPGKILLDADLLAYGRDHREVLCLMGQRLGKC